MEHEAPLWFIVMASIGSFAFMLWLFLWWGPDQERQDFETQRLLKEGEDAKLRAAVRAALREE